MCNLITIYFVTLYRNLIKKNLAKKPRNHQIYDIDVTYYKNNNLQSKSGN